MSIIKDFIDAFLDVADGLDDANPDDLDRATDAAKKIAISKYYGFPLSLSAENVPADPDDLGDFPVPESFGDSEEEHIRLLSLGLEDPDDGCHHG